MNEKVFREVIRSAIRSEKEAIRFKRLFAISTALNILLIGCVLWIMH